MGRAKIDGVCDAMQLPGGVTGDSGKFEVSEASTCTVGGVVLVGVSDTNSVGCSRACKVVIDLLEDLSQSEEMGRVGVHVLALQSFDVDSSKDESRRGAGQNLRGEIACLDAPCCLDSLPARVTLKHINSVEFSSRIKPRDVCGDEVCDLFESALDILDRRCVSDQRSEEVELVAAARLVQVYHAHKASLQAGHCPGSGTTSVAQGIMVEHEQDVSS